MDKSEDTRWCPRCYRLRPHAEMLNTPSLPIYVWCIDCMTKIYPLHAQFRKENIKRKSPNIKTARYFKVKSKEEKHPEPVAAQQPPCTATTGCDCSLCRNSRTV